MSKELDFKLETIKGNSYQRIYANDTHLARTADMFTIDFIEEYVDSIKMYERDSDDEKVYLTRELKGAVALPIEEARDLANRILGWLGEEEEKIKKEEVEMS
ncbi:TPA: hypothetical protein ACGXMA_004055 [Bacillus cereus]|uniref:hypothetical protein n=1 Tax=Bacillus cereus group TaxID=86661 RepID=UPI00077274AE|nr:MULTISPECIES: hypothetical protein [Bacillus cereus group]AXO94321.1 hypothetical protein DY471_18750 [Bacillus anthracis]KXI83468.1 hypothetical protein ACS52_00810 [Bacillus cereus]MBL3844639.1 hypothetical protein [Bacillus cereus]MCE7034567.1 hypothetical protein [Bacillus cereus]MCU9945728.1 hypothetical protein [Bacillus pacificus]